MGIIGQWLCFALPVCIDDIDVGILPVSGPIAATERYLISLWRPGRISVIDGVGHFVTRLGCPLSSLDATTMSPPSNPDPPGVPCWPRRPRICRPVRILDHPPARRPPR